jgi:hypothetical protein
MASASVVFFLGIELVENRGIYKSLEENYFNLLRYMAKNAKITSAFPFRHHPCSPLARVTDIAFRELCKRYGCGLTVTEMISANDLARKDPQALHELHQLKFESKPRCLQLYGRNMDNFITAAKMVQDYADILDLNFGCPYHKIIAQGLGCALTQL